ncbi:MAG TPA: RluA family pseudouridine synthase [Candidatus Binatia bacterium]|nr:RluA family pseudouridine synthase [Candidatus Binatia bacterium]
MREIVLPADEAEKRLGSFLKREFPIGYVRKLFRKNGVRINGRRAKETDVVRAGDRVQVYLPFDGARPKTPSGASDSRMATVYEDDSLLVINKPAGLAVHEGKTVSKRESILGILEHRYRDTPVEPKLVHRLDKDTSGLLVIAKDQRTAVELENAFKTEQVQKQYLCLVVGRLPNDKGTIDVPLPGRQGHPVRAVTRYRVVKRFLETTLLRVDIDTGRLHQIRLHFAKLGYPVVLDDQHGDYNFNKRFRQRFGLKRQFLHAEKLAVKVSGRRQNWSAPLSEDLRQTLLRLSSMHDINRQRE